MLTYSQPWWRMAGKWSCLMQTNLTGLAIICFQTCDVVLNPHLTQPTTHTKNWSCLTQVPSKGAVDPTHEILSAWRSVCSCCNFGSWSYLWGSLMHCGACLLPRQLWDAWFAPCCWNNNNKFAKKTYKEKWWQWWRSSIRPSYPSDK